MPFYELVAIIRPMPKQEVVDCLKRVAKLVWDSNGVIKKIEFMGLNQIAHGIRSTDRGVTYNEANFFLYNLSLERPKVTEIKSDLKLDVDILKSTLHLVKPNLITADYVCTLPEELLPPSKRPSVQPLLEFKNVRTHKRVLHH